MKTEELTTDYNYYIKYFDGYIMSKHLRLRNHKDAHILKLLRQYNVSGQSDGSCNMTDGNCLNHIKESAK